MRYSALPPIPMEMFSTWTVSEKSPRVRVPSFVLSLVRMLRCWWSQARR